MNKMKKSTISWFLLRRPLALLHTLPNQTHDFTDLLLTTPPGPALVSALDRTGTKPTHPLLQHLLDNCGSSPKLAYDVLAWADSHPGYSSSVGVFNGVVKVFARAKQFESALSLVLHRLKTTKGIDTDTFAILIRRFSRAGLLSLAIRSLEFACSLNLNQSLILRLNLIEILFDSFCKEGLVVEASDYLKAQRERDPCWVPSIHIYNNLLSGWFRARQLERVHWVLDEMEKNKVKRNDVIYTTLVERFCWMSRVEVAIELVQEMKDKGIQPNASMFNPIIEALGKMGKFQEALGMLERFLVLESGPTFSTYDSLVKSFCKAGDIGGANKILKMMISRSFIPTAETYSYLFRYFANWEMTEEGLNLHVKMIESGHSPDRISCLILVKMLVKEERFELAMQIRKYMKAKGYNMDFTIYTMMVHFLCETYRLEEALAEIKEMIDTGFVPQLTTCQILFDELKKHVGTERGRELSDIVAYVPHLTMLQNMTCREDYDLRVRRRAIIGKAKAISEILKISRNPRKLVKMRRNWKSLQE